MSSFGSIQTLYSSIHHDCRQSQPLVCTTQNMWSHTVFLFPGNALLWEKYERHLDRPPRAKFSRLDMKIELELVHSIRGEGVNS